MMSRHCKWGGVVLVTCLGWSALAQTPLSERVPEPASETAVAKPRVQLVLPAKDALLWRGIPNDEIEQGPGFMMYPVGNLGLVGLLVGIATHATLESSVQYKKKTDRQTKADLVLLPLNDSLKSISGQQLMETALPLITSAKPTVDANANGAPNDLVLEASMTYGFSQDKKTLALDLFSKLYRASDPSKVLYNNVARVISQTHAEGSAESYWLQDNSKLIKSEASRLYSHAVNMLVEAIKMGDKQTQKTIRYAWGDAKKMERGTVLATSCGRMWMRNLRHILISAPFQADDEARRIPCTDDQDFSMAST